MLDRSEIKRIGGGLLLGLFLSMVPSGLGNEVGKAEAILERMRSKVESVAAFRANVSLRLDVEFIRMPEKFATLSYRFPDKADFDSEDFIVVPKRGLDLSYRQIFESDYAALFEGEETVAGHVCHVVKVVPTGKSRLALATLYIDADSDQTVRSEFVTRKNGTYWVDLEYDQTEYSLPSSMKIRFEMEKFNLPLRYLGKNVSVDRTSLKEDGVKEGLVELSFSDYEIELAKGD